MELAEGCAVVELAECDGKRGLLVGQTCANRDGGQMVPRKYEWTDGGREVFVSDVG